MIEAIYWKNKLCVPAVRYLNLTKEQCELIVKAQESGKYDNYVIGINHHPSRSKREIEEDYIIQYKAFYKLILRDFGITNDTPIR